jgi:hypothetical protein
VFEEFTAGYQYWAFGDEDVLYGDVDRMLRPHLDGFVDLVVPASNIAEMRGSTHGHLTVIRNDSRINELAVRDPAYKQVLASEEHWAYDETSWKYGTEISSFTKVVKAAEGRGELSIRWGVPAASHFLPGRRWSDTEPRRRHRFVYDGRTLHDDDGTEILYYHWGKMRHRTLRWPNPEQAEKGFGFDRYGFYDPKSGPARLVLRGAGNRLSEQANMARSRLSKWGIRLSNRRCPRP